MQRDRDPVLEAARLGGRLHLEVELSDVVREPVSKEHQVDRVASTD